MDTPRIHQTRTNVLYDKDREKLINDVLDIRQLGDYKPKYKLAAHANTTQQRPQEFEDFEQWLLDVKSSYLQSLKERKLLEKQSEYRAMVMGEYGERIMNRFMKIQ